MHQWTTGLNILSFRRRLCSKAGPQLRTEAGGRAPPWCLGACSRHIRRPVAHRLCRRTWHPRNWYGAAPVDWVFDAAGSILIGVMAIAGVLMIIVNRRFLAGAIVS